MSPALPELGTWGLFPWFDELGPKHVHPDDVRAMRALFPYGKVFLVVGDAGGYVELCYRDRTYRVGQGLFRPIPPPRFTFDQPVIVMGHAGVAWVREIEWHHERSAPMFFLERDGKRLKKRYWAGDLCATHA
jgi:hypothetical protein